MWYNVARLHKCVFCVISQRKVPVRPALPERSLKFTNGGCVVLIDVPQNDIGVRIENAKRIFERFLRSGREKFEEVIGIDRDEYDMVVRGEILLAQEHIDAMVDLGFDSEWICGDGNPKQPVYCKRGS